MKKWLVSILTSLLIILISCSFIACGNKNSNVTLDIFNVPEEIMLQVGESYTIPNVVAFDSNGNEYTADVRVESDDGEVEIIDNKITINSLSGYEIIYTIVFDGQTLSKVTKINVQDTVAPIITIDNDVSKHKIGEPFELPKYSVIENGGIASEIVSLRTPSGELVEVSESTYIPAEQGRYIMTVTVTDQSNNIATEETIFFASGEAKEYDVFENFEFGYDPTLISNEEGAIKFIYNEQNSYVTTSVSNYWPFLTISLDNINNYMQKGYDYLHISIWGNNNNNSHTLYYGYPTGDGDSTAYVYENLSPGQITELLISSADIEAMRGQGRDLILRFINESPNETFEVCVDNIYGIYKETEPFNQNQQYNVDNIIAKHLSDVSVTKYDIIFNGSEQTDQTGLFVPSEEGEYILRCELDNNLGYIFLYCQVYSNATSISFENGQTSLIGISAGCTVEISSEYATEGKNSLKITMPASLGWPEFTINRVFLENVFADSSITEIWFDLYLEGNNIHNSYYSYAAGLYQYLNVEPNGLTTVKISRAAYYYLLERDAAELRYIFINDGDVNENFTIYLDNFRGVSIKQISFEDGLTALLGTQDGGTIAWSTDRATEGTHSMKVTVDENSGYPKLTISMDYLGNVFADAEITEVWFDIYNGGGKTHTSYYGTGVGQYQYTSLTTGEWTTIKITRAGYEYFLGLERTTLNLNIQNDGDQLENFTYYVDNFRGVIN